MFNLNHPSVAAQLVTANDQQGRWWWHHALSRVLLSMDWKYQAR